MREFIFRGKRVDNGQWVMGSYLYDDMTDKHYIVPCGNIIENDKTNQEGCLHCISLEVIPETIGQYTNNIDRIGRKIFEGDILDYNSTNYEVIFETRNGSSYFGIVISPVETWNFCNLSSTSHMKVIGNVYDNNDIN